jgi:hypothetical protein
MTNVRWHLWEGNTLVLEISAPPSDRFHTVTYEGGGWPRHKTYRAFEYTPSIGDIHAQLERERDRLMGGGR